MIQTIKLYSDEISYKTCYDDMIITDIFSNRYTRVMFKRNKALLKKCLSENIIIDNLTIPNRGISRFEYNCLKIKTNKKIPTTKFCLHIYTDDYDNPKKIYRIVNIYTGCKITMCKDNMYVIRYSKKKEIFGSFNRRVDIIKEILK